MALARAGLPDEDDGLRPIDEAHAGELPDGGRRDLGRLLEAEVLEALQAWEVRLGDAAVPTALGAVLQLGLQQGGEKRQVTLLLPQRLR